MGNACTRKALLRTRAFPYRMKQKKKRIEGKTKTPSLPWHGNGENSKQMLDFIQMMVLWATSQSKELRKISRNQATLTRTMNSFMASVGKQQQDINFNGNNVIEYLQISGNGENNMNITKPVTSPTPQRPSTDGGMQQPLRFPVQVANSSKKPDTSPVTDLNDVDSECDLGTDVESEIDSECDDMLNECDAHDVDNIDDGGTVTGWSNNACPSMMDSIDDGGTVTDLSDNACVPVKQGFMKPCNVKNVEKPQPKEVPASFMKGKTGSTSKSNNGSNESKGGRFAGFAFEKKIGKINGIPLSDVAKPELEESLRMSELDINPQSRDGFKRLGSNTSSKPLFGSSMTDVAPKPTLMKGFEELVTDTKPKKTPLPETGLCASEEVSNQLWSMGRGNISSAMANARTSNDGFQVSNIGHNSKSNDRFCKELMGTDTNVGAPDVYINPEPMTVQKTAFADVSRAESVNESCTSYLETTPIPVCSFNQSAESSASHVMFNTNCSHGTVASTLHTEPQIANNDERDTNTETQEREMNTEVERDSSEIGTEEVNSAILPSSGNLFRVTISYGKVNVVREKAEGKVAAMDSRQELACHMPNEREAFCYAHETPHSPDFRLSQQAFDNPLCQNAVDDTHGLSLPVQAVDVFGGQMLIGW